MPRRSTGKRNKKYIKRSRGAGAQQQQLLSLQRQVTKLKNTQRQHSQRSQYIIPLDVAVADDAELNNGQFNVYHMTDFTGQRAGTAHSSPWTPIFQARAAIGVGNEQAPNKATILNYDVQLQFSPKNSLTPLTPRIVRVYWITLKKETAMQTLEDTEQMTTAGLRAATVGQYTHVTESNGGLPTMVKFNPAAFIVRAYREFTLANIREESSVPDDDTWLTGKTSSSVKRVRMRIKAGNRIKAAHGGWLSMDANDVEATDRHFLVTHVGGWAADGDNGVHMSTNIVATVRHTN